jgi:hypothetical protein
MDKKNFKAIGSSILKDILDSPVSDAGNSNHSQLQNTRGMDSHKIGSSCSVNENEDTRLHVYISGELEDKLLAEVYRRKRDKNLPKSQANKRAVVEDALVMFLSSIKY